MMIRLLVGLPIICWASAVQATSFTSNCASPCNWNAGSSWSGGSGTDWPSSGSDTATIVGQQTVTIPNGVSITTGAVTLNAGGAARTTLQVNGTLTLAGAMTLSGVAALNCGDGATTGGTIDLAGNTITNNVSDGQYNFKGIAGAHCTIQSTGAAGTFANNGVAVLMSDWSYVDISNMNSSVFGRCQSLAGAVQKYSHVTFTNMADINLEYTCVGTNSGFHGDHLDFRSPKSNAAIQPDIDFGATALGTNTRYITNSTWYNAGATSSTTATMQIRAPGFYYDNVVMVDWHIVNLALDNTLSNSYASNHLGASMADASGVPGTFNNSYIYDTGPIGGSHVFMPEGDQNLSITNNIFESRPVGYTGFKWFLMATAPLIGTWGINNNILLGLGSMMDFPCDTACTLAPTIIFKNNTVFMDNQNSFEGTPTSSFLRLDHPVAIFGTGANTQWYDNLAVQPSTSVAQNTLISLWNTDADQIDYTGYNVYFALPSTAYSIPGLAYSVGCQVSGGGCALAPVDYANANGEYTVFGTHDFSVNPNFVDPTRTVATWDLSLGGPGTEADAYAQMLKLNGVGGTFNPSFTPANLLIYVKAGFVPQNAAVHNAGRTGGDIGAIPYQAPAAQTSGIVQ